MQQATGGNPADGNIVSDVRSVEGLHDRSATSRIAAYLVLATITGLAVLLQFVMAYDVAPPPFTDSAAFIPPAVEFQDGRGLRNPIYPLADTLDSSGDARYLFHGPLFPWLLGSFVLDPTPRSAFLVTALLRSLTLVGFACAACAVITWQSARQGKHTIWMLTLAASLLIAAQAGMQVPQVGRPEALSTVILMVGSLAIFLRRRGPMLLAMVATLGLAGATHPAGAVLVGVLFVGALAYRFCPARAFLDAATVGLGGIVLALVILEASPHGAVDTIQGIRKHLSVIAARTDGGLVSFVRYSFFWWDRFFFFAFILLIFAYGLKLAWAMRGRVRSPWQFWGSIAAVPVLVWLLGIRVPPTNYNLSQFVPFVMLALLSLATILPRPRMLLILLAATGAVSSLALVKLGVELRAAQAAATTYSEARAELQSLLPAQGCILVDTRTWALLDDYRRVRLMSERPEEPPFLKGCEADLPVYFLLVPPRQVACEAPAGMGRTTILVDHHTLPAPSILGYPVTKFPPGFAFCFGRIDPR